MDLRRMVVGLGRLSLTLGLALSLVACAGKSVSHDNEDGKDNGGGGTGATSARGGSGAGVGTSGASGAGGTVGRGGSSTGGTSNSAITRIMQTPASKIDLLFMIDNSISMADKQRMLAEAVPVLVQRLADPLCIDSDGNPTGGSTSSGCPGGSPEFPPIQDIHIGIITSSLGNHGGDVCVPDPSESPPRALNDAAQLLPSVRTGLYSWNNTGFLVWDPRTGSDRPMPDPHPGVSAREQSADELVSDFTNQVTAAGERGCGYEASLEAWYRFLVDPEPVSQITNDGQFSIRGPINPVVIEQRARFLRPDSILGIVMLTDENDCSVLDENGQQGWLVGRRTPMPRGSDACAHPEDPNVYRCCIPCVLLDIPDYELPGCDYSRDVACNTPPDATSGGGHSLSPIEDSTNLRCFDQVRRFGLNWLYPWQRYVDALTTQRIALRDSTRDVINPIFAPGLDGTPARDPSQVFLVGIVGVPWQDLATDSSLSGRSLTYLTSEELAASGRWDAILGDPDNGIRPLDPFMVESNDRRVGMNPITGDVISSEQENAINGHDQNIVNRDDLQYACTFDLVPDVPCTMANQDGCDCNASERDYDRPTCQYGAQGTDGTQTHAKAYPGTRHLQVLRGLGDNAVVASICPKNVMADGSTLSDPDYGYNPAVSAMVGRLRQSLQTGCLPREFETNASGELSCNVIEAKPPQSPSGCSCNGPRTEPSSITRRGIEDELTRAGQCDGDTGISCSDYCICELSQFAGGDLEICQNSATDSGDLEGYCYIDPENGVGNPDLVAACPPTQRRLLRFMGPDFPSPNASVYVSCTPL